MLLLDGSYSRVTAIVLAEYLAVPQRACDLRPVEAIGFGGTGEHTLDEARQVLLVPRETPVAGLAGQDHGKAVGQRIVEQDLRGNVIDRIWGCSAIRAACSGETLIQPVIRMELSRVHHPVASPLIGLPNAPASGRGASNASPPAAELRSYAGR